MDIDIPIPEPTRPKLSTLCTPEQSACIDFIHQQRDHLVIDSVAGSGKSFTLVEMCVAINHYFPFASIALVMYNSKNVPEMKARIAKRGALKVSVGTVHSFGFAAYKEQHGFCEPNRNKADDVANRLNKQFKFRYEDVGAVCRMVSLAKDTGVFAPFRSDWEAIIENFEVSFKQEDLSLDRIIDFASRVFDETINDTSSVDFSDMIALPLYHSYPFRQYDFVLVDEAQDINRCRLLAIIQMLKSVSLTDAADEASNGLPDRRGRLIAVGDAFQSIYAFTGADAQSIQNIQRHFSATQLSLTTCFRCDKSIIRHVNHLVPHIRPRSDAGEGRVASLPYDKFEELLFEGPPEDLQSHAILCRKNAPLMSLAFRLSANGIRCRMEGRDIGRMLVGFARRFKATSPGELGIMLGQHLSEQSSKLTPYALDTLRDKIDCLTTGLLYSTSLDKLYSYITSIFSDSTSNHTSTLTLSSIHKAKGLEWPTVYILGENLWMPSPLAKTPTAIQQEKNLIYVARTRAMHALISVTMEDPKK